MFKKNIQLQNLSVGFLSKKRSSQILFKDLDLTCKSGEIIGLVGKNGVGKSTLLKTLAGLLDPLKGNIQINGKILKSFTKKELARQISYVSTEIPVVNNLTVYDFVSYGRFPYTSWLGKLSYEDKNSIEQAIAQVGIQHISLKFITEISDGERQRAMIARALAQDTEIIILDEPTAFLDLPNRYEVIRLLNGLANRKSKTIIFSTHDLAIALHEADNLWLLTEGKIITGAPEDLIINRGFHKLFENSQLDFNLVNGEIRLMREQTKKIGLEGKGELYFWTMRALERIGFDVTEGKSPLYVQLDDKQEKPCWILMQEENRTKFNSIYDLVLRLK